MPNNKGFLLRLIKLDDLLRSGYHYTIDELIERVSEYLEDNSIYGGVSERTLRGDIKFMREKFSAPIKIKNGRYYYEDPEFSLFDGINQETVKVMLEAADILEDIPVPFAEKYVELLSQMLFKSGFDRSYMYFPFVLLENNQHYTGLKWLPVIYDAIENNQKLYIDYHSFDGEGDFEDVVRPYFLREYRNRWFLFGKPESQNEYDFYTIPLDRIHSVKLMDHVFYPEKEKKKILEMLDEFVGVTYIRENPVEEIELEFRDKAVGYVRTKPLHKSQRIILEEDGKLVVSLRLRPNYELKQIILTYVPNVRVLKPKYLHAEMVEMLQEGLRFMLGD